MKRHAQTALAVVLLCGIAYGVPTRGRFGSVPFSAADAAAATGWSSNGTTASTSQNVSIAGGVNVLSTSSNVIRGSTGGYFHLAEASGFELYPASSGRVRVGYSLMVGGPISFSDFTDDSATTGNRTVNASRGFNAFAATDTAITITNSNVTALSQIVATIMTNDATAILKNCVPAAGSFTCTLNAAATGTTKIAWTVLK